MLPAKKFINFTTVVKYFTEYLGHLLVHLIYSNTEILTLKYLKKSTNTSVLFENSTNS